MKKRRNTAAMVGVKVVLFVSGKGADDAKYKPDRDESQWWSRHDALVRTVAAFLYGPSSTTNDGTRELVLIFDEDLCVMEMHLGPTNAKRPAEEETYPSEKAIISTWKEAVNLLASSQTGQASICRADLVCRIHAPRIRTSTLSAATLENKSKREILESMQKSCSLDFLRQHGLNCSLAVALRKVNRKATNDLWYQWQKQQATKKSLGQDDLENILSRILKAPSESSGGDKKQSDSTRVVAGILHESGENELPVWRHDPSHTKNDDNLQVCFFLGAVRDMSKVEKTCLTRVASRKNVPVVKVRLGPVAEFTSKILTVVAFHQSRGVLNRSLLQLMSGGSRHPNTNQHSRKRRREEPSLSTTASTVPSLHIFLMVPLGSSEVTNDLHARTRVLWCLVRCVVVGLWRSRLVGSGDRAYPLRVSLSLYFQNDTAITLDQEELVQSMAEQHQAAPSEYQILTALQKILQQGTKPSKLKAKLADVMDRVKVDAKGRQCFAIDLMNCDKKKNEGADLSDCLYSQDESQDAGAAVESDSCVVLMSIGNGGVNDNNRRARKKFAKACQHAKLPLLRRSLLSSSTAQDREAAMITMLQHLFYQNRMKFSM